MQATRLQGVITEDIINFQVKHGLSSGGFIMFFDSLWMKKEARSGLRTYLAKELEAGKLPKDFKGQMAVEAQKVLKGMRMAERAPGGKITPEYAQAHIRGNPEATLKYLRGLSMEELGRLRRDSNALRLPAERLYQAARTKINKHGTPREISQQIVDQQDLLQQARKITGVPSLAKGQEDRIEELRAQLRRANQLQRTAGRESAEDLLATGKDFPTPSMNPNVAPFDVGYVEGFERNQRKSKKVRGAKSSAEEVARAKDALKQRLGRFQGKKKEAEMAEKLKQEIELKLEQAKEQRRQAEEARRAQVQKEQEAINQQYKARQAEKARQEAQREAADAAQRKQNREQYEEYLKKNPMPTGTPSVPSPAPMPKSTPNIQRSAIRKSAPKRKAQQSGLTGGQAAAIGLGVPAAGLIGYQAMQPQEKKTASWGYDKKDEVNKASFVHFLSNH